MNVYLNLNGYQDRVVGMSRHNSVRFVFVWMDVEESLKMKDEVTRRFARSDFGRCCQRTETDQLSRTTGDRRT
jgi:hypothetical protein